MPVGTGVVPVAVEVGPVPVLVGGLLVALVTIVLVAGGAAVAPGLANTDALAWFLNFNQAGYSLALEVVVINLDAGSAGHASGATGVVDTTTLAPGLDLTQSCGNERNKGEEGTVLEHRRRLDRGG